MNVLRARPSVGIRAQREGADRACTVTCRQTELWIVRRRQLGAPYGGAFQSHGEGEYHARAVQGRGGELDRSRGGADRHVLRRGLDGAAFHSGGQA